MTAKLKKKTALTAGLFLFLNALLYLRQLTNSLEPLNSAVDTVIYPDTKSNRPILRFDVGNGLHSQLMSFIDGMVLALLYQEHYDVQLPTMWGSAYFNENRSQPMKFGDLYHESHFKKCISNFTQKSFKIVSEIPKNYVAENLSFIPKHVNRKINDAPNWNSTQTALRSFARSNTSVNIGRFYARWNYEASDSLSIENRRRVLYCIKPSPMIEGAVAKAVNAMRSRYSSEVTAIHPRLEDDWREHCNKRNLTDGWIDEEEWCRRLEKNFQISTPILLIGGARVDRAAFEQKNLTVFSKYDLLQPGDLSSFKYASSLSAIDFFLALASDNFIGFMWSAMDVLIVEARLYNCLPVQSVHVQYGTNWLAKVSAWSKSFFYFRLDDLACHHSMHSPCTNSISTTGGICG